MGLANGSAAMPHLPPIYLPLCTALRAAYFLGGYLNLEFQGTQYLIGKGRTRKIANHP